MGTRCRMGVGDVKGEVKECNEYCSCRKTDGLGKESVLDG